LHFLSSYGKETSVTGFDLQRDLYRALKVANMPPFNFAQQGNNTTTSLPPGWTNHGIGGLICGPADWFSVLTFYGINYLAHCLTIKYYPAETGGEKAAVAIMALLLPSSGITRAVDAIKRYSRFRRVGELEQAAFAGALVMVVRNREWIPQVGDNIRNVRLNEDVSDFMRSGDT
jgi:hypothetical protein